MDGVHDMGGMHGFGAIDISHDEPLSRTSWRARMFGIELSYTQPGGFNVDWMRHVMECMPPAAYLSSEYYDRWYWRDVGLLVNAGWVGIDELVTVRAASRPAAAEEPLAPEAVSAMLEQGVSSRRPAAGVRRFSARCPGARQVPRAPRGNPPATLHTRPCRRGRGLSWLAHTAGRPRAWRGPGGGPLLCRLRRPRTLGRRGVTAGHGLRRLMGELP